MSPKSYYYLIRKIYKFLIHTAYDSWRFLKYSSICRMDTKEKVMAKILWDTHIIEKGNCLKEPRLFYGKQTILHLVEEVRLYLDKGGEKSDIPVQMAVKVLDEYILSMRKRADGVLWHKNEKWISQVIDFVEELQVDGDVNMGGRIEITKEEFQKSGKQDFSTFCSSRYSVRNFTGEQIPEGDIRTVIDWSRKSPSVCNRQCVRVMLLSARDDIEDALALQEGSRGFGDNVSALLLIAADLNSFIMDSEKNQNYIDAGFFAMNVLYGFHYMGYGACPLHWFWGPDHDIPLRKRFDIPESWNVVLMIAVGVLPDSFSVPIGFRRPIDDILVIR